MVLVVLRGSFFVIREGSGSGEPQPLYNGAQLAFL